MLLRGEGLVSNEDTRSKQGRSGAKDLCTNFLHIHESSTGAAPRRYITFLKTYKSVYNNKKDGVVKRQQHLQVTTILFNKYYLLNKYLYSIVFK